MHTRSKRYLRRQRGRQAAQRRAARKSIAAPSPQYENRLAVHVAAALIRTGAWHWPYRSSPSSVVQADPNVRAAS